MDSLTINVTDPELSAEVDTWTDGATYNFTATQTSPGKFDLVSAEATEEAIEESEESESGPPMPKPGGMKTGYGKGMPPALTIIMGGKGKQ